MHVHTYTCTHTYTYTYTYTHTYTYTYTYTYKRRPALTILRRAQSWQPPAPRKGTETGWGAALTQVQRIAAS